MVRIKKDAPKFGDGLFWDWMFECGDFDPKDYLEDKIAVHNVSKSMATLKAFKKDLEKAGVFDD